MLAASVMAAMLPGAAVARDNGKSDCKKGGWRELVRADGSPFADQGECVGYVANGGTPQPPEVILAIAYSDLNGTDGYQVGTEDVLISKLVDANGTGVADGGDLVVMGRYPTTLTPSGPGDFGVWGSTRHRVTGVLRAAADQIFVSTDTPSEHRYYDSAIVCGYQEYAERVTAPNFPTYFYDIVDDPSCTFSDTIAVVAGTPPSLPGDTVSASRGVFDGDSDFLDVEIR
jgi:hypothetical protein